MADALKIGIAGLGTVGASLVQILQDRHEMLATTCGRAIEITAVTARDRSRDRGVDLSKTTWFDDAVSLAANADIDVFIELMGGAGDPAYAAVKTALGRGIHVVTANKALLAAHGIELAAIAENNGALLNYEAAVAGGIPVIKALRESMTGNTISRVYGIMNGTCNYILTKMEKEGLSFEACLEGSPEARLCRGRPGLRHRRQRYRPQAIDPDEPCLRHGRLRPTTSISKASPISPSTISMPRPISDTGSSFSGSPSAPKAASSSAYIQRWFPYDSVIAQVDGVTNAVAIESDILGELLMVGPGAGGNATASAVLGDVADIAKSRPGAQHVPAFGRPTNALLPYKRAQIQSHEGGYFIRLKVVDRTGVFASIASRMAENGISLESIMQHSKHPKESDEPQTIILVTHATAEHSVRDAIVAIKSEGYLVGEPQVIRIERPKAA